MTSQDKAPTSSSMEEVAAKRPEEVRPLAVTSEPHEAQSEASRASPSPRSARPSHRGRAASALDEKRGTPRDWLRARAKAMRSEMTPHEKAMWRLLHEGELVALNWRRQAAFGSAILDFVSHSARLVIEVDGAQHATLAQSEHDALRTAWLEREGYRVLRFWNNEAMGERQGVWETIYAAASETSAYARMLRWRNLHDEQIRQKNAHLTSSSMEEVAAKRPEEVRPPIVASEPHEAQPDTSRASPSPRSARPSHRGRAGRVSSIEDDRH